MPLDENLTDKKVVATETKTNKKNKNNSNNKKFIKKTLKMSKTNKKQTHLTNVNNKKKNVNNKNSAAGSGNGSSGSSSSSNCGNNNVEVANDEIIEELFDFSDTDLKELDDIKNPQQRQQQTIISQNNSCSSAKLSRVDSNKLDDNEKINNINSKTQLQNMANDNNNNRNKAQEENIDPAGTQVELESLTAAVVGAADMDKQHKDMTENNELVTTTAPVANNIISAESNVDKSETDKNQQKVIEPFMTENSKKTDLLWHQDDSEAHTQLAHSSLIGDSEADNNDIKFATTSDIKSNKTDNTSESLPLIGIQEGGGDGGGSSSNSKPNANSDPSNNDTANDVDDDDDDDDNETEYAEPYDELLVQFLDESNQIAEARLAARRHARAEAREIRMRELERQQKEQESNADRVFDMHSTVTGITPLSHMRLGLGSSPVTGLLSSTRGNSMSSRRSSEDSLEEEGRSLRDIRHELKDVEERFRKAMIANAQLDNDRASQTYQIQLLKDKLEDMEESYSQLQRECKEKTRDCNALKRSLDKLNEELKLVQGQLNERDTLITEQGLVIVAIENEDGTDAKRALVSVENAQLLGSVQGSLDVRLKKFSEEKQQLHAEVQRLQEQLETYKSQGKGRGKGNSSNGPMGSDDDDYEAQREANKIISDYKYKLQKAEQEIASLQSSLARSETQVIRYKSTAEAAEKAEAELKIERRKLQRENREAMEKLEELETSNNHLLKRLDKLKNAKSALLKDL